MAEIAAIRAEMHPWSQAGAGQADCHRLPLGGGSRAAPKYQRVVRRRKCRGHPAVPLPEGVRAANGIRLDKLLAKIGLADSVTTPRAKSSRAVEINGEKVRT